jgi:hypothetical protein
MCPHQPPCPPADRPDRHAAHTVAFHPEQGWSLLCNEMIVFDDMGEILPGDRARRQRRRIRMTGSAVLRLRPARALRVPSGRLGRLRRKRMSALRTRLLRMHVLRM